MDMISELPKEILQRILYLLSQEEAVRTSILSKSWRYIWCTRANLDFSLDTFKGNYQEFISVVDKNLVRYRDQGLCLEEFDLCISLGDSDQELVSLLENWIPTLTSMGVKKFRLSISSEVQFERRVKLPSVVFGSESLQKLHVERFVLKRKTIKRLLIFKHLKSLCLRAVLVEDDTFQKIISSCPLVETMRLDECEGLNTIKVNDLHNLKKLYFTKYRSAMKLCRIEIHPPSLEKVVVNRGNIWFHKGADFRNLINLNLYAVDSFDHFSSCKFPSLERMNIYGCNGLKEIMLFIDAPNILDFGYQGDFVPSISFATTLNEWKSHIQVGWNDAASSSWYLKLNELLESLSQSIVSLIIDQYSKNDEYVIRENVNLLQDNGCGRRVVVESLSLCCHDLPRVNSSLLYGALSACRPRNIGNYQCRVERQMEVTKGLWKILMQREIGDQFKHVLWMQDLEEVSFEVNESSRVGWHRITLSELPNYQKTGYNLVRFALKWRENRI